MLHKTQCLPSHFHLLEKALHRFQPNSIFHLRNQLLLLPPPQLGNVHQMFLNIARSNNSTIYVPSLHHESTPSKPLQFETQGTPWSSNLAPPCSFKHLYFHKTSTSPTKLKPYTLQMELNVIHVNSHSDLSIQCDDLTRGTILDHKTDHVEPRNVAVKVIKASDLLFPNFTFSHERRTLKKPSVFFAGKKKLIVHIQTTTLHFDQCPKLNQQQRLQRLCSYVLP